MKQEVEERLWEEFRNGSNSSFESIYRKFSKELFIYGRRIHNDRELVNDCIQQLFMGLLERRKYLSATSSPRFYLYASLRRQIIKELKKQNKFNYEEKWNSSDFGQDTSLEDSIINEEKTEENKSKLKTAITSLPAREKELLYLKFYSGLSNDEIAEVLSIKKQSVKNTISRAIQRLKNLMISFLSFIGIYHSTSNDFLDFIEVSS